VLDGRNMLQRSCPTEEDPGMSAVESSPDLSTIEQERNRIRATHLRPTGERPASTARGLHHTALVSSDVETTVRF
jgi:hypothetical protein